MARLPAWPLIPIVAGSGFAGLGYEIVWTRMLSLALGTEMMAVLGVVAGFFGGLALGAFVLDSPIRRTRSPRLAYALLEGVIGVWGLVSVVLLPAASRALPPRTAHAARRNPGIIFACNHAMELGSEPNQPLVRLRAGLIQASERSELGHGASVLAY